MLESLNTILPIFFSLLLMCSLLILFVINPIHSVLLLILLFCNSAILLLLFNMEFLALMLIIIYIGAVTILFLFVLMMLDIQLSPKNKKDFYNYFFFSFLVLITFGIETFISTIGLLNHNWVDGDLLSYTHWITYLDPVTNLETIGQLLYTFYFVFLLMAGLILLIALIGAVMLTYEPYQLSVVDVSMFKQVSRLKNNAVFNIK